MPEFTRFFFVSFVGVVVDFCIAYAITYFFASPLWVGATIGFFVAAAGNYALHEVWTFQSEERKISSRRAMHYIIMCSIVLISRLMAIEWLSSWMPYDRLLFIFVIATGISFFVNFLISKFVIFYTNVEN